MEVKLKETKILLVDDDENFGFALKTLLKSKGLEINSYTNPKDALEYLKKEKFDMILLDYYMPEMTGEEFLVELRKFDSKTIVFLETAYSQEKPELDMLETLNIQGYIDKNKDPNEIFLDIVAGIKMSELINTIQEKDKKINILEYRNEFFGKFLYRVLGEVREKAMIIGGLSNIMSESTEEINEETRKKYSKEINEAIGTLQSIADTLELENLGKINISQMVEILNSLYKVDFAFKKVKLDVKYEQDSIIKCDSKVLIYVMAEVIEYLLKKEITDILIECTDDICFNIKQNFDSEIVNKINDLVKKLDSNIKIINDGELKIICE